MKYTFIYILLLILFALSACKTKQEIVNSTKVVANKDSFNIPINKIQSANFNRLKVDVNIQGNSFSSNAAIKIIRDSIIQLSIQPALGIEVVQINFMPKKVTIIDKMHARYFNTDYDFLLKKFNIFLDYYSLQGLLLNEVFIVGKANLTQELLNNNYSQSPFPDGILIKNLANKMPIPTEFIINKDQQLNYTSLSMPLALVSCRYIDFKETSDLIFPSTLRFSIIEGPRFKKADISIQSASFNKEVKINISNLSNYEQVNTFEQLIP